MPAALYPRCADQIVAGTRYADLATWDARGVHLALADSCVRWAPSERAGISRSQPYPRCASSSPCGPASADVLQACETGARATTSRRGSSSHEAVTNVLTSGVEAVNV